MHLLWIAVVIGVVAGLPTTKTNQRSERLKEILSAPYIAARNNALEGLLLGIIEDLRETMLTGTDSIPILDPLEIEHITIDDQTVPLPGIQAAINDLKVTKLSTFEVNDLSVTMTNLILQRYRIIFDGEIPTIDVDAGNYDLSVNAMGVNVFGNGDAKIKVTQPRLQASLLVAPRISISGIFLNLLECDIKFSLGDLQPHITGLFNDEAVSDFVSLFLKYLVTDLLDLYEDEVNEFLSTTLHEIANDLLRDLNLIDILG